MHRRTALAAAEFILATGQVRQVASQLTLQTSQSTDAYVVWCAGHFPAAAAADVWRSSGAIYTYSIAARAASRRAAAIQDRKHYFEGPIISAAHRSKQGDTCQAAHEHIQGSAPANGRPGKQAGCARLPLQHQLQLQSSLSLCSKTWVQERMVHDVTSETAAHALTLQPLLPASRAWGMHQIVISTAVALHASDSIPSAQQPYPI